MKSSILFLLVTFFLITSCNKKENFISEVIEKTKNTKSLHYKFVQKYYYLNGLDTTSTQCEAWVIRDSKDTLRSGYVWVDNKYRPYNMIYDKGNFYLAIPPKKITALYPNYSESFISDVDWIDIFLNPEILQNQLTNPKNIVTVSDTVFDSTNCKKIYIEFKESNKVEKKSHTYILSKNSFLPLWTMIKTENKYFTYFDEIYFSDFEIDKVNREELNDRQKKVLVENPIENRSEKSELSKLESMLHIGEKAPLFEGNFYADNSNFELSDFIGKNVILFDFWYTHCPLCVKSMPNLIELHNKYEEKGLKIIGLNSVDNQPHSLKYLSKFLSKRAIDYDIIMTKPEVDLMYKIRSYPTMYLINKDGKIAFVEVGYNKEKFDELEDIIIELLNE